MIIEYAKRIIKMKYEYNSIIIGLIIIVIGISLWYTIGIPQIEKLSANYMLYFDLHGTDQMLSSINNTTMSEPFSTDNAFFLITQNVMGDILEIQSVIQSFNSNLDTPYFYTNETLHVNRITRQYTQEHVGLFMFPPHVEKKNYYIDYEHYVI